MIDTMQFGAALALAKIGHRIARDGSLGREPRTFPAPDEVPADATRGGCSVEVNEADVHISADGRVWSVVTGAEGDDDD